MALWQRLLLQCRMSRRHGFSLWVRKIPEGGLGNPLQYSCLENPKDKAAEGLQSMGCKQLDMTERLSLQARVFHTLPAITNMQPPPPIINILHHGGTFVTINEPTLTYRNPPKSIVYFQFIFCCTFYGFGQTYQYNAMCPSSQNPPEYFRGPKNPLCSAYSSFPTQPLAPTYVLLSSQFCLSQNVVYLELHCLWSFQISLFHLVICI